MNIKITGKELKATEAIKDYVEKKLERIERYFEGEEINANVKIKTEKSAQIAEMQAGTDATKSPNAIAFNLKVTPKLVAGTHPEGKAITPGAALETNVLKYDVPNCNATFTCQITGASVDNSFSTLDQTGTYKATLYLSNTTAGAL